MASPSPEDARGSRWERIQTLCEVALGLEEPARAAYLSSERGGDGDLCRQVEALLQYEHSAENSLRLPVAALAGRDLSRDEAAISDPPLARCRGD